MQLKLLDFVGADPAGVTRFSDHERQRALYRGAEYLVMADLSFAGLVCYSVAEGLPYDVVVDLPSGLKRIQVKSTSGIRVKNASDRTHSGRTKSGYIFGDKGTGRNLARYDGLADFFALVALDLRLILYTETRKVSRIMVSADRFTPEICRLSLENIMRS